MADAKPAKVQVEAIKFHSSDGVGYDIGDTYDVDESAVENLAIQGMAIRTDRVAQAKKAAKAVSEAKPAKPAKVSKRRRK